MPVKYAGMREKREREKERKKMVIVFVCLNVKSASPRQHLAVTCVCVPEVRLSDQ